MKQLQIVFLGAERVGKTSTIRRFLYGSFEEETDATLGQCYNETIYLPNGTFQQVQVIDTAGSDEFPAMRKVTIKNGDYFVVMYAVNDRQSYQQALKLCQEIRDLKGKDFSKVILVGNMIDKKEDRDISTEEVLKKTITEKLLWCTETSAKLNCNIRCLFQIILKDYVKLSDISRKRNKNITRCRANHSKNDVCKTRKMSVQHLVYCLSPSHNENKYS
uniref:GTP-binding protein Di-Ras2-like n=1 Tax=Crassostrea virginica TaxID=6565 RepID=A0A8B8E6R2_CRAVI|nr:GTP-binding protein Di-Ras2-like [Crassostrea virginica]